MKTVNEFDSAGNFIFWEDDITGTDIVRRSGLSAFIVHELMQWMLIDEKPLKHFPHQEVSREQWGTILGAAKKEKVT